MEHIFRLFKLTVNSWLDDKAPRLGAALAFYSVLSLGPLLVISIAVAGVLFGRQASEGQLLHQMQGLLGREGAQVVQTILANSRHPQEGLLASLLGLATLLFGASGVFGELQDALNTIWKTKPHTEGSTIWVFIKQRFLSFTMVLAIGFLLLISLAVTAAMAAMSGLIVSYIGNYKPLFWLLNFAISLGVITLLFAMIFKILPDVHISWRDVWAGAALTSALFTVGKFLIGLYLGQSAISSTYGAAGSFVVLLVWIYYSAQILYFGAEFTRIYAIEYGSKKASPKKKAA